MPELQVHERLRRRLSSAPFFQDQRLRQSVGLLRRPLFDVREHADRCWPGTFTSASPTANASTCGTRWRARRRDATRGPGPELAIRMLVWQDALPTAWNIQAPWKLGRPASLRMAMLLWIDLGSAAYGNHQSPFGFDCIRTRLKLFVLTRRLHANRGPLHPKRRKSRSLLLPIAGDRLGPAALRSPDSSFLQLLAHRGN